MRKSALGSAILCGLVVIGALDGTPSIQAAEPSLALYASIHSRWVPTRDVTLFSLVRFTFVLRHADWPHPSTVLTIRSAHVNLPVLYRVPMHRTVLPNGFSRFMVTFRLNKMHAANRLRATFQASGGAGQHRTASLTFIVHFPAPGSPGI